MFAVAAFVALFYAGQPLLDMHAFRQAQTALSAYWLGQNGFHLAYQTPVGGPPWTIPFEFPLYQGLSVVVARVFEVDLALAGRLLSFFFLCAMLVPVRAVVRRLSLSPRVFLVFAALLFSSPLYLYWGRSFMIETTALFLAVACVPLYLDILLDGPTWPKTLAFTALASLAFLQKATTALPVFAVLGLIHLLHPRKQAWPAHLAWLAFCYGVPLAFGWAWTQYTDQLKELTPLGQGLTSKALSHWNWGTLSQRLTPHYYRQIFTERLFNVNLAGSLGMALLLGGLGLALRGRERVLLGASLLIGLLGGLLFFNLHYVHNYYQTANAAFLLFACALVLGEILPRHIKPRQAAAFLTLMLCLSNLRVFKRDYWAALNERFSLETSLELQTARLLKASLAEDETFVAFGQDWSSVLPYFSERKAFCVPPWHARLQEVIADPQAVMAPYKLGAVVVAVSEPKADAAALRARFDRLGWVGKELRTEKGAWRVYLAPAGRP
jgi:hypothetical protein